MPHLLVVAVAGCVAIQPLGECHICHLLFAILYEYVFILFGQNQLGDGAWTAEAEAEAVAVTGTEMGRAGGKGRGGASE